MDLEQIISESDLLSGRSAGKSKAFLSTMLLKVMIEVDVNPSDTIDVIKQRIEEMEGIPTPQQRIIYGGRVMVEDKTVEDYSLTPGDTLHLVLILRGGSY